jgi:hypothetical protein
MRIRITIMKIPIVGINGTRNCTVVLLVSYRLDQPVFGLSGKESNAVKTEPNNMGVNVKIIPYVMMNPITVNPR